MVGPGWVWDVDGLCTRVEALQEGTTYSESTSARDGLGDGDTALLQGRRVGTVGEKSSGLCEVGYTSDASILLVKVALDNLLLSRLNGWKDVWLALVVTVCADT